MEEEKTEEVEVTQEELQDVTEESGEGQGLKLDKNTG